MFSTPETINLASDIFMDYNYGSLEIRSGEVKLQASIRDIYGKEVIR